MSSLHIKIRELALQVDRVLLQLADEDHLRLDLTAHESSRSALPWNRISNAVKAWLHTKSWLKTTSALFVGLFLFTNAPAYSKWIKADLLEWQASWSRPVASAPAPEQANSLANDWGKAPTAQSLLLPTTPTSTDSAQVSTSNSNDDAILPQSPVDSLAAFLWKPSSFENRIDIPDLKISAPIVEPQLGLDALKAQDWETLEAQIHDTLLQGVVHYPGTAEPGQKGNTVLTGHSSNLFWEKSDYNTVFALLPKLKVGAEFTVTYHQNTYHYRVTDRKEVSPKEVDVLSQDFEHRLTLITCTPVGTSLRRLILTAELVED